MCILSYRNTLLMNTTVAYINLSKKYIKYNTYNLILLVFNFFINYIVLYLEFLRHSWKSHNMLWFICSKWKWNWFSTYKNNILSSNLHGYSWFDIQTVCIQALTHTNKILHTYTNKWYIYSIYYILYIYTCVLKLIRILTIGYVSVNNCSTDFVDTTPQGS